MVVPDDPQCGLLRRVIVDIRISMSVDIIISTLVNILGVGPSNFCDM